jgi:hypothetical protein
MCSADGCADAPVSRGFCRRHYLAWYRQERAEQNRDSQRRWRERVDYNAKRRKPKQTRPCAECGEPFETAIPHKAFCRFTCKKRAENRRRRVQESA